jgi:hypothetical protein
MLELSGGTFMPHPFAIIRRLAISAGVAAGMSLAAAENANAVSLYWAKTPVHSSVLNECLSFAYDAMRNLNIQNIRRSRDEVAGTSGGTYAAITRVGTSPVTAVVIVAGDDQGETSRVADSLRRKITGIIKFD